jgi:RNA recognition motif-containing protein
MQQQFAGQMMPTNMNQQHMLPQNSLPFGMQQQLQNPNETAMTKTPSYFENEKTLYIGNLAEYTYDNELYKFFKNHGHHVAKVKVLMDANTKKSRRFGYLNFKTEEEAVKCLNEMNNQDIGGRQIVLNRKKEIEYDAQANLLVKNLPEEMTQNDLSTLFSQFGKIACCKLEIGPDNKSRMFGYV